MYNSPVHKVVSMQSLPKFGHIFDFMQTESDVTIENSFEAVLKVFFIYTYELKVCPFEKGLFSILNKLENRGHFYDLTQVRNIIGLGHNIKFVEQKKIFSTIYIISVFRVKPNN